MLLSFEKNTMDPKFQGYLGTNQHEGNMMWAFSSAISATASLFIVVLFFQKEILCGLITGAVIG